MKSEKEIRKKLKEFRERMAEKIRNKQWGYVPLNSGFISALEWVLGDE